MYGGANEETEASRLSRLPGLLACGARSLELYRLAGRLPITVIMLALLALVTACSNDNAEVRPNILVITSDDLGRQLGSYGDDTVPTPNLDAIAARGTRFSRAYVTAPSCSSSRSSFLTGLYPHQNGQLGLAHHGFGMIEEWPTIPGLLLQQQNYYPALGGKLHVAPASAFAFFETLEQDHQDHWTMDIEIVGEKARRYFEQAGNRPFYIQFDLWDPHRPFVASRAGQPSKPLAEDEVEPFSWSDTKRKALRADIAGYYNSVARMDAIVGRILMELRQSGALENTVILFWSDNGPPFARAKTTLYEQGTRVPLIMAGPGIVPGQVRDELVSMVDIMPTLLTMAAAELPAGPQSYPGMDLGPLLRGEQVPWREYVFTESTVHRLNRWNPRRAVTDGKWKLIDNLAATEPKRRVELFDLAADPEERENLANRGSQQKRREQLLQLLGKWRASTGDPLLDSADYNRLSQIHLRPDQAVEPWYKPK